MAERTVNTCDGDGCTREGTQVKAFTQAFAYSKNNENWFKIQTNVRSSHPTISPIYCPDCLQKEVSKIVADISGGIDWEKWTKKTILDSIIFAPILISPNN